jgi:FHA domain-containing protein
VARPGSSRRRLAQTLSAAHAGGLLSTETFSHRLGLLLDQPLIEPRRLIGDLQLRRPQSRLATRLTSLAATAIDWLAGEASGTGPPVLLALDWDGGESEMLIGRHLDCDVVLNDPSVSRRHARLVFRHERWVLQDLASTNGTLVNGVRVGRCELRPGDQLVVGTARLQID